MALHPPTPERGMARLLRLAGLAAVVLAWAVIALSALRNPWFDLLEHAFSDLGGPGARDPWLYNYGLVATGSLTCVYSLYLAWRAGRKAHIFASAFLFVAGLFLALIGVFPASTRPHTFVSTWFFVQAWMAMVASAVGLARDGARARAALLWAMAVAGPLGALLVDWPSVAILETYGIAIVDVYVVVLTTRF